MCKVSLWCSGRVYHFEGVKEDFIIINNALYAHICAYACTWAGVCVGTLFVYACMTASKMPAFLVLFFIFLHNSSLVLTIYFFSSLHCIWFARVSLSADVYYFLKWIYFAFFGNKQSGKRLEAIVNNSLCVCIGLKRAKGLDEEEKKQKLYQKIKTAFHKF